jgi:hypothetical protein
MFLRFVQNAFLAYQAHLMFQLILPIPEIQTGKGMPDESHVKK